MGGPHSITVKKRDDAACRRRPLPFSGLLRPHSGAPQRVLPVGDELFQAGLQARTLPRESHNVLRCEWAALQCRRLGELCIALKEPIRLLLGGEHGNGR